MKIRVALLDSDINYLERIAMVFTNKYMDKLEIYSFSDKDIAVRSLETKKIDVFIANQKFDIKDDEIPEKCSFAYLTSENGIEEIRGVASICKFQKVDLIYKQILNLYSNSASNIVLRKKNIKSNIIFFTSFSGGTGTTSIAVATSKCLARKGEKVIYVNLEKNGDPDIFFNGEGQFTLGDVIYALKSKKQNLTIKIESSLKKSVEGVEYLAAPKIALDFLELQISEIKTLLNEILTSFDYDYIIVDCRSEYDELSKMVWNMADKVIVVSDGSEISNSKTERMSHSIEVLENDEDSYSFAKAGILYNKFSNKVCKIITGIKLQELGGIPKIERATSTQIVEQISAQTVIQSLI